MKTFLAWVGAFTIMFNVLGALNVIDYHVCIKDAGKCPAHGSAGEKK